MKHKFCALLLTLLILLGSGTSQAVIVPDSTGQNPLPLSQIPDIIRHVTNRTSGDISMDFPALNFLGLSKINYCNFETKGLIFPALFS